MSADAGREAGACHERHTHRKAEVCESIGVELGNDLHHVHHE